MSIVAGALAMGRVERVAYCSIATRFQMINGIPLRALDSFVDVTPLNGAPPIPIPLNRRSKLAGFLRPWITIVAGLALVGSLVWPWAPLVTVPLVVWSGWLWLFFGRLSPSEVRLRLAYATWLGAPFDPAYLADDDARALLSSVRLSVDEQVAQQPGGYREKAAEHWRAAVIDARDPALLIAAITRARLERHAADAAERAELDALHAALWKKLDPLLVAGEGPRAYVAWQELAARDAKSAVGTRALAATIAFAAVCAPLFSLALERESRPTLAIVNGGDADGLTVLLDGEPIATNLPRAQREGDGAFVKTQVAPGSHEIVARAGGGEEIDRRRFVAERRSGGFLYVPVHAPHVCFYRERYLYGSWHNRRNDDVVKLDNQRSLHIFEHTIDAWFHEPPATVKTSSGGAVQLGVRARRCVP